MTGYARHLPVLIILLIVLALHLQGWRWLMAAGSMRRSLARRVAAGLAMGLAVGVLLAGFSLSFMRVLWAAPPGPWIAWVRAAAMGWALVSVGMFLAVLLWRHAPSFDPARRRLLQAAGGVFFAAPVVAGGMGFFVERVRLNARQLDLPLDGLPPDLQGLRLAQLTDIHLGPFLSEKELARAVDMANEFRPHLTLVTGDLITDRGDPLDACLRQLSRLKASDGIFGCMGNHEGYIRAQEYTAREGRRLGIEFLRSASRLLRFGNAYFNLAGVDHQTMGGPYLRNGERLVRQGSLNLLLSHNPDVFPVAAAQGYDLTMAGHTHGGQLAIEISGHSLNLAKFFTPYVYGVYRQGRSVLHVSRGIGTVGIPVRLGAPPEVNLVRLCAT
jgi:predicted MPP superfamily phosphohydrolase